MAAVAGRLSQIPEAIIFPFNIPTISGFGASAGFNFLLQDRSGTLIVEQLGEQARDVPGRGAPAAGAAYRLHVVRSELPADQGRAGPGEGAQARRARQRGVPGDVGLARRQLRERLQPVRPALPRLRPVRGRLPAQARRHRRGLRPQPDHQHHDPALDARDDRRRSRGRRSPRASTCSARWRSAERRRAATPPVRRSPPSKRCSRRRCRRRWASRTRACPTRRRRRRPPRPTFILAIVFVFLLARRHVRELAAAVGRPARLAARRARRVPRRVAHGLRQQRLRADRSDHARRPRRQERHPDRRVRQGEARCRGHVLPGRRARVGAAALPARSS